jgi:hypothetical protein
VAIVQKLKPECGFVLLDGLERFDVNQLREFCEWLKAQGMQGIGTRVSTGSECSIVIEDGLVVGTERTEPRTEPETVQAVEQEREW